IIEEKKDELKEQEEASAKGEFMPAFEEIKGHLQQFSILEGMIGIGVISLAFAFVSLVPFPVMAVLISFVCLFLFIVIYAIDLPPRTKTWGMTYILLFYCSGAIALWARYALGV
ncbi:MAG: hypothetical protein MPJ24_10325, partial [Pirellulaceae bacterium]|nr:hypothetical protein [Pirellulaceae bacterium]